MRKVLLCALALSAALPASAALPVTLLALDEARGHTPGYALLVECAADAPRADDTDGLFVEVYARQTHNTEVEIARADVGAVQTAI